MEIYHVLNRGVDKRQTFMDSADYARFAHDMYEFNDTAYAPEYGRRSHVGHSVSHIRERLVDIYAWCLMRNHFHLLLTPLIENGVSLFMHKLCMGYTKYFNKKHERTGVLWQGAHKRILVERDAHFIHLPYYIHLNPLDYTHPAWRKGTVRESEQALAHLRTYRWSSHRDYLGEKNFPSLINPSLLKEVLGTRAHYEQEIRALIKDPVLAQGADDIEL